MKHDNGFEVGAVPRISRLMALAIRMQDLVDQGEVADLADLARLAHVSRARITQIMNLLLLAPDIQEAILFLPRTDRGLAAIRERQIRPICAVLDWRKQRRMWDDLVGSRTISRRVGARPVGYRLRRAVRWDHVRCTVHVSGEGST